MVKKFYHNIVLYLKHAKNQLSKGKPQKKLRPYPSSLILFRNYKKRLKKVIFFLMAGTIPPPLSLNGTAKNFFAASLMCHFKCVIPFRLFCS